MIMKSPFLLSFLLYLYLTNSTTLKKKTPNIANTIANPPFLLHTTNQETASLKHDSSKNSPLSPRFRHHQKLSKTTVTLTTPNPNTIKALSTVYNISSPILNSTITPTITTPPITLPNYATTVTFLFVIEHPSGRGIRDIISTIDASLHNYLSHLLNTKTLTSWATTNHELTLLSILSVAPTTIKSTADKQGKTLTKIISAITLSHDSLIPPHRVREILLLYSEDVVSSLVDFETKSYVGPKIVTAEFILSLPLKEVRKMTDEDSREFERILLLLLTDISYVKVSSVVVGEQMMGLNDNGMIDETSHRERNRGLESHQETNSVNTDGWEGILEVHITITGEYQPPPEVDMNTIMVESLNNQMTALMVALDIHPAFSLHLTGAPRIMSSDSSLLDNDMVSNDHDKTKATGTEGHEEVEDTFFSRHRYATESVIATIVVLLTNILVLVILLEVELI